MPNFNVNTIKSNMQAGLASTRSALSQVGTVTKSTIKSFYLYIPKDYDLQQEGSLNNLIRAADELGIVRLQEESNGVETAKHALDLSNKLLSFTKTGIAISATKLDELLKKHSGSKLPNSLQSANNINNQLGKASSILSTLDSFLGTALAGMELDSLIKKGNVAATELAKASIGLINEVIGNISNSVQTIEAFSSQLAKLGVAISQAKGFTNIGNKLQHLNFSKTNFGLEIITGLLSGVSAGFVLADQNSSTGKKIAAGFELSNQVIGNVTKAISSYILAQRVAAGLSTTGAVASLITSSVMLAISPLAFMNAVDKFNHANALNEFAKQFQKFGYEGDNLLAEYQRGAGTIEASLTTISTALGAVSAGVSAAAIGSAVGAPIALLVAGVTGLISGILEASKQAMFESVANRLQGKILEWEKQHGGQNYFDKGYDSRYQFYLTNNLKFLSELNKELEVERVIAITQQRWDENIGELAGITKLGDRINSGKAYADAFEYGQKVEAGANIVLDAKTGIVDISNSNGKNTQALYFTSPLLTAGNESHQRLTNGKYAYINKLKFDRIKNWQITDGNANSKLDFSRVIQRVAEGDNVEEIGLVVNAGAGNDDIFVGQGKMNIDAGDGHDRIFYSKEGGLGNIVVDGSHANEMGSYKVDRNVSRGEIYHEVVKRQDTKVGKRTETIEYRDYELRNVGYGYQSVDNLKSVEEVIGSQFNDVFKGSRFDDIFHGGAGDDVLEGEIGNDRLFGGRGNDRLVGGIGDDIIDGGAGNDVVNGGSGDDVYIFRKGDGVDTLYDHKGNDKLALSDANISDFVIERTQEGILMKRNNSSDSINMPNWYMTSRLVNYHGDITDDKIEQFIGKDGNYVTSEQIDKLLKDKKVGERITSQQLKELADQNKSETLSSANIVNAVNRLVSSISSFGVENSATSITPQPILQSPQNMLTMSSQ